MPDSSLYADLHLSSLYIEGFRGISKMIVPNLSRVTLITGKNSVGKTTVLESVRTYAERGQLSSLTDLLRKRNEFITTKDEEGDEISVTNLSSLFYGRDVQLYTSIIIGSIRKKQQLRISLSELTEKEASLLEYFDPREFEPTDPKAIKVSFDKFEQILPWVIMRNPKHRSMHRMRQYLSHKSGGRIVPDHPPQVKCLNLGPGLLSDEHMAKFWDTIALTEYEDHVVEVIRDILGIEVERIAVVSNRVRPRFSRDSDRNILVKIADHINPVPLKSLGDGAVRLFGVVLAFANCRNGFLLIDEAENGIHYTVQSKYWEFILHTAEEFNVQVFATTHSWDCVSGFAQATMNSEKCNGGLLRIERENEQTFAIEYSKEEILVAAEHGIEVR